MKTKQILKTVVLVCTLILIVTSCNKNDDGGSNTPITEKGFITTWKTTVANEEITITKDFNEGITTPYNYNVDWGDGNIDNNVTESITHSYTTAGIHTVTITGDFPAFNSGPNSNAAKLITIENWGSNIFWESMYQAFSQCKNLTSINATDIPNLGNNITMYRMFYGATNFNSDISNWDVSNVTNMNYMFSYATNFNSDISNWDVSNVTGMRNMFHYATNFNSDISDWDVSNVTNMSYIFHFATNFNSDISNWDVSKVTGMDHMFHNAESFNQDLSAWETDNVTACNSFSVDSGLTNVNLPTEGTCFNN